MCSIRVFSVNYIILSDVLLHQIPLYATGSTTFSHFGDLDPPTVSYTVIKQYNSEFDIGIETCNYSLHVLYCVMMQVIANHLR